MTKRSSKRLLEQQQPDPVFFLDRNLGGKKVPDALRSAGWKVELHRDHFPEHDTHCETGDADWIRFAGAKGWIILTADVRTLYNTLEKQALLASNTLIFMLCKGNMSGEQMAQRFIDARVGIWRKIKNENPVAIFKAREGGQLDRWDPKTESFPGGRSN